MTIYGYIGLGSMGAEMAARLTQMQQQVTVFDINDEAIAVAVERGAQGATSASQVGLQADVVSICVPGAEHIDAVLDGPDGLLDAMSPGKVILVHSTVHPDTVRSARAKAAEHDVLLFDACVAGGGSAARIGELVIFAGDVDAMPEQARAVLDIYGSRVISPGPVGSGAALKLAVNVMTYAQFAAASTGHELLRSVGVESDLLWEALRHNGMLGTLTEQFTGGLGIGAELGTEFADALLVQVGIAQKDLSLVLEMGGVDPDKLAVVDAISRAMPKIYDFAGVLK